MSTSPGGGTRPPAGPAPYTGHNFFGDTIQGPLFYVPWRDLHTTAENTQIIGGVCGGLSYFGTIAAQAPRHPGLSGRAAGHCAYAVRVKRGEWKGGFGGPDGGMHNHIFGSQAPTSYLLMENVFADNDKADQAYLWAAQGPTGQKLPATRTRPSRHGRKRSGKHRCTRSSARNFNAC